MRFMIVLAILASFSVPASGMVATAVTTADLDLFVQEIQTDAAQMAGAYQDQLRQRLAAMQRILARSNGKNLDGLMAEYGVINDMFVSSVKAIEAKALKRQQRLEAMGQATGWASQWQAQKQLRRTRSSLTSRVHAAELKRDRANTPENQWRILVIKNRELLNRLRAYH